MRTRECAPTNRLLSRPHLRVSAATCARVNTGMYKVFYVLNWIWRLLHDPLYTDWIVWIAGIIQVLLYIDFFINFYKAKKEGMDKDVLLGGN
jgi:hypothetical protein